MIDLQTFERSRASLQRQQESLMVQERELAASAQKQLDLSAILITSAALPDRDGGRQVFAATAG